MPDREFRWTDIAAHGYTVCFDRVLDLSRFEKNHPGGAFLHLLRGKNASFQIFNTHQGNRRAERMLESLQIGTLPESELPEEERDLLRLYRKFRDSGLFRYRPRWLVLDFAKIGLPLALSILLAHTQPGLAGIFLALHVLLTCWWVHDVAHNSVFGTEKASRFFTGLVSIAFTGTYAVDYHYVTHRVHHGFTNILGFDGALSSGPIHWHLSQESKWTRAVQPFRLFIWLGPLLSLIFPLILASNLALCLSKKTLWVLPALALRWWIFAHWIFPGHLSMLLLATAAGGYALGLISSLNHFHMRITEGMEGSYLGSVARSTQNMGAGLVWTELTGGLNWHIEHHLFTTMPRRNYPVIAPEVKELFRKHGYPYQTCTGFEAFGRFLNALKGDHLITRAREHA